MRHRTWVAALGAVASVAAAGPALALDPGKGLGDCTMRVWHVRDGLPGAWVRAMAQTPDGYLWIATASGLARYDGGSLEKVGAENGPTRLSDVIGLGTARDGTLWILPSFGEPVCRRGRTLGLCLPDRLAANPTISARPYDVHEDRAGTIWLAEKEGIWRFAGGQLTLRYPAASLPFPRPNGIHADARGRLWVGASNGLYVSEGGPFRLHTTAAGPLTRHTQSFFESPHGHMWVTMTDALVRIDVASGATTLFEARNPGIRPTQVIEDRDGNVWIGGHGGLTRFRDGTFVTFGAGDGLPDVDVYAVFEDREGSLWVGTRVSGLVQFTDRTLSTHAGPPSLLNQRVESLAEDAEGTLWFGSQNGLHRWRDGEERVFHVADGLPGEFVTSILPAPDGTLWVGTDRGLTRLRAGRIQQPALSAAMVWALYIDHDGALWVGSDDGLARLEGERLVPLKGRDFESKHVRGVQQAGGDPVIWAATEGGLARVEDGVLARVPASPQTRHPRAIHRDQAGMLWISTARSGLVVRLPDGTLRTMGAQEGLHFEQLYQLVSDDLGFLWVGSRRGVLRLDKRELLAVARGERERVDPIWFDTADDGRDVSATRARQPGAMKTRDGRIWFASDQGLLTIDPRRVRRNAVPPPVWIERVEVDGRAHPRDGPHRFAPGAGTLEIHFAGVTLLEPQKVAHRYLLEGFDSRWVEAGTRRAAYYTNLAPGTYRFRVQARNADGVWNEAGDSVELVLAPHFWQTAWFYGLVALLVGAVVFSAHRTRLARVRSEYQAVLAERGRLARELHDSLLQGMSAVAMQIYGLRKRLGPAAPPRPPETIARDLQAIEAVVTANLEETRRYVWDLRDRAQGDEDLPGALGKLMARLTEGQPVEGKVSVEGTPFHLPDGVQAELLRIAQEAITNVLKHADARHIDLRTCYEGGAVVLSVSDDGRGFEPAQAPGAPAGHFGLLGMRERAARLGQLTIESRPGQGTTLTVKVSAETASKDD